MVCSSMQPSMASQMRHARTMRQMTSSASPSGCARHAHLATLPLYVPSDPPVGVKCPLFIADVESHRSSMGGASRLASDKADMLMYSMPWPLRTLLMLSCITWSSLPSLG